MKRIISGRPSAAEEEGNNVGTSVSSTRRHPLGGIDPHLVTSEAIEFNESHRLDGQAPEFQEGGKGTEPVYADEDAIWGLRFVKVRPRPRTHIWVESFALGDEWFSGANEIEHASPPTQPIHWAGIDAMRQCLVDLWKR